MAITEITMIVAMMARVIVTGKGINNWKKRQN
jgi:hypothetical protein